MKTIRIIKGSHKYFLERLPDNSHTLTEIINVTDRERRTYYVEGTTDSNEKIYLDYPLSIDSDEYSGVAEHVITNFAQFITKLDFQDVYIHNPPSRLEKQIKKMEQNNSDSMCILEYIESYRNFDIDDITIIKEEFDKTIIGQNKVKVELLPALYNHVVKVGKKPLVLMLYGSPGIGKTETAKYLSEVLDEKLFRSQFSMFQNESFASYLFGSDHNFKSFGKDLMDRTSNVILLDEFDKASSVFHSAFYQLFDEGIFEDANYKVNLENSVIICTSNYKSESEIEEHLGGAMYSRFDFLIHFEDFLDETKIKIGSLHIESIQNNYPDIRLDEIQHDRLEIEVKKCTNVREIRRVIEGTFALLAIKKL